MTRPILVFDDDCGFCTWCAAFVRRRSDCRVVGFSAITDELRERLPDDYETCSHLVTDDAVYSCGASVEEALLRSRIGRGFDPTGVVDFLRHFEDYNRAREAAYRWLANHRWLWGWLLSADSVYETDPDEED